jgi:glycosyltransferase involved in cell wall biosynthesis
MSFRSFLDFVFIKIPLRFFKKNVVVGLGASSLSGTYRVLIYYKTDPLFSRRLRDVYAHTNNAEIMEMVEIFNRLGFIVDLVDRDAAWHEIEPLLGYEYDVYLANAAGNSAPLHNEVNAQIKARYRIFYAAGPEPEVSNRLVEQRHLEFKRRSGGHCALRRLVRGKNFINRFSNMDAIFYIGNKFSEDTYSRHNVPAFRIYPSTPLNLRFDITGLVEKRSNHFVYFGGSGLICKGLDLVLEAFDGLRGVKLDICAPAVELDFWDFYKPLLARNPHIHFHGFVSPGSKNFSAITASAAFQIFPGSAEGCATSVLACMRRGVIPIVTRETGVDLGDYGVEISPSSVDNIRSLILRVRDMPFKELRRRAIETYLMSTEYTLAGFSRSFEVALLKTFELKEFQ